jgi:hypothetical protein
MMVHEVYEGVRRYTRTTFTMKRRNLKTTAGSKFIHFLNLNIKFGPSFKRKHSQVRVQYW